MLGVPLGELSSSLQERRKTTVDGIGSGHVRDDDRGLAGSVQAEMVSTVFPVVRHDGAERGRHNKENTQSNKEQLLHHFLRMR